MELIARNRTRHQMALGRQEEQGEEATNSKFFKLIELFPEMI